MDESESAESLYLSIVSETARVPLILEHVAQFARRQGIVDSDGLLLVVRELLMNAIVHGNQSNCSRLALLRVELRSSGFEVQVDDEGSGFDHESLILGLPEDPQSLTRRGLVLANELSESLTFERGGSRVRASINPSGQGSEWKRGQFGFAVEKNSREASCTSPMAKSE
jgi:anti-sigma regulatory factor (Ser/Thr protein kinase)